ncbi:MAG TPA: SUF system NifU family Fe-S cluster assembly protein [Acidimicrobiia bacterium]
MSDELGTLYRDVIVDHGNHPRNHRALGDEAVSAEGINPLCGDEITVYLRLDGDRIAEATFESQSCAISTASASLMTEALIGKTRSEALDLFDDVRSMLTCTTPIVDETSRIGKLRALSGVSAYPTRVKCATLPWHTFREALDADRCATISAESTK